MSFAQSSFRLLDETTDNNGTNNYQQVNSENGEEFDPFVFWGVNCFLIFLLCTVCSWCWCFGGKERFQSFHESAALSDQQYQASIRRRQEELEAAKRDTPEQRKLKLVGSFQRCQVKMVVTESDLIENTEQKEDGIVTVLEGEEEREEDISPDEDIVRLEEGVPVNDMSLDAAYTDGDDSEWDTGYLTLRRDSRVVGKVPNCCAICLGHYEVGETVVWSSNAECPHAFHEECMLDWLMKLKDATSCPCCRQDFTDLELYRRERKITWVPGNTFNLAAVSLR